MVPSFGFFSPNPTTAIAEKENTKEKKNIKGPLNFHSSTLFLCGN